MILPVAEHEYTYRYVIPAVPLACLAAALTARSRDKAAPAGPGPPAVEAPPATPATEPPPATPATDPPPATPATDPPPATPAKDRLPEGAS